MRKSPLSTAASLWMTAATTRGMSISNQKIMLRDFAEKHGMFQYEYYVDDGYTGRNFNRPAFQRMIADIEAEDRLRHHQRPIQAW